GDVGPGGHVPHLHGLVAAVGRQRHSGGDDPLAARRLVARPLRVGRGLRHLDAFDDGAGGEGAAAAHGDEGGALVAALELVKGGGNEAAAGGAHRVAESDGPTVDVNLV